MNYQYLTGDISCLSAVRVVSSFCLYISIIYDETSFRWLII